MLRFGLVGCGTHAQWAVIPAMRDAAEACRLVAVADINPANMAKVTQEGVARFASHEAMLAAGGIDAVYVATLPDTHARVAIDALRAGMHVVCEKPMATSVADCQAMADAAAQAGRLLTVNFECRYYPQHIRIRDWIAAGHLGRVEAIHIQHFWDGHKVHGELGARRGRLMDLSGGLDCGIHQADLARYFCGGDWSEIVARGRWFGEGVRFAPHISILAGLDSGVMATLNVSTGYGAQMRPEAVSDMLTIVGDHGVINHFKDETTAESVFRLTGDALCEEIRHAEHGHAGFMTLMLRDFVSATRDGVLSPCLATARDGVQAQRFVEEANRLAVATRPGA